MKNIKDKIKTLFSHKTTSLALIGILIIIGIGVVLILTKANDSSIMVSDYKTSSATSVAMELYSAGKLKEAEAEYREIVTRNPRDFVAWNGLGNTLRDLKDAVGAEEAYLRVINIEPKFEFVYRNLLTLYLLWPKSEEIPAKLTDFNPLITKGLAANRTSVQIIGAAIKYYQQQGDTNKVQELEQQLSAQ